MGGGNDNEGDGRSRDRDDSDEVRKNDEGDGGNNSSSCNGASSCGAGTEGGGIDEHRKRTNASHGHIEPRCFQPCGDVSWRRLKSSFRGLATAGRVALGMAACEMLQKRARRAASQSSSEKCCRDTTNLISIVNPTGSTHLRGQLWEACMLSRMADTVISHTALLSDITDAIGTHNPAVLCISACEDVLVTMAARRYVPVYRVSHSSMLEELPKLQPLVDSILAHIQAAPATSKLKCVVLSTCDSDGVAKALCDAGVPYVVYWDSDVIDSVAAAFSVWFLWCTKNQESLHGAIDYRRAFTEATGHMMASCTQAFGCRARRTLKYSHPPKLMQAGPHACDVPRNRAVVASGFDFDQVQQELSRFLQESGPTPPNAVLQFLRPENGHQGGAKIMLEKYPDRVPVLFRQGPVARLPAIDKKLLVPRQMCSDELTCVLRKQFPECKNVDWDSLCIVVSNVWLKDRSVVNDIYDLYKDYDDCLRIKLQVYPFEKMWDNAVSKDTLTSVDLEALLPADRSAQMGATETGESQQEMTAAVDFEHASF